MDDRTIIRLFRDRDQTAVEEASRKYGAFCTRIAVNFLGRAEDAEECVNDAFLAAWNTIPPMEPHSLGAYLGRLTRNFAIDRYRANRAQKRCAAGGEELLSELGDCLPDRTADLERTEESTHITAVINRWLDRLPDDDRAFFVRRYWYGDAVSDLAELCGCTPNQMAQRMLRLRRSLRAELEKEDIAL